MGAEDADVIVVHLLQVLQGDVGVQGGIHAPLGPVLLHHQIAGVAAGIDGVVKGIVNDGVAQGQGVVLLGQGVAGQFLGNLQGNLEQSVVLVLPVGQQDAAQHPAFIGKGVHPVFFIVVDGVGLDQALAGQVIQLFLGGLLPLVQVHIGVSIAVDQGVHSGIGLGHLGCVGLGQGIGGVGIGRRPLCEGGGAGHGGQQGQGRHGTDQALPEVRRFQVHIGSSQIRRAGPRPMGVYRGIISKISWLHCRR